MNTPSPSYAANAAVSTDASSKAQTIGWHAETIADDDLAVLEGDDPDAGFVCLEPRAIRQTEDSEAVHHGG